MRPFKKAGEGFSFSPNPKFEAALLEQLQRSADGELSSEDMLNLSAAQGVGHNAVACPRWHGDCANGYASCANCAEEACLDRTEY